ncbi:MAG: CBS domain-containing protein [Bacillota bacterium]|nr:CBS domain-containing protein [Bacillota bacterium]
MRIQAIMTKRDNLSVVSSDDCLQLALDKMKQAGIKSIPVVNKNKFIGIIFKDKILEACLDSNDCAKEFSERKVETLIDEIPVMPESSNFESVVNTLREKDAMFLAITDSKNNFVGIVTHKSIFDEFTDILGLYNGTKLTVFLYDMPGQLAKISQVCAKHNANIHNLVASNPKSKLDIKEVIVRVDNSKAEEIKSDLERAGYRVDIG